MVKSAVKIREEGGENGEEECVKILEEGGENGEECVCENTRKMRRK